MRRSEERPRAVHLAADLAVVVAQRRARPRRRATTAGAVASASTRTARESRAAPPAPPAGSRRAGRLPMCIASSSASGVAARKYVDEARILVDDAAKRVARRRRTAAPSLSRHAGSTGDGVAERRLERRGRVDLERPQRDAGQAELGLDHLALLGHAQRAVDRSGRLRADREVRRPAAAADAAAAAVEERDRHAVRAAGRRRSIPAPCRAPTRRRGARRPSPSPSSRPSLPGGRRSASRVAIPGDREQRVDHRRRRRAGRAPSRRAAPRGAADVTPASRWSSSTARTSDGRPAIVMT